MKSPTSGWNQLPRLAREALGRLSGWSRSLRSELHFNAANLRGLPLLRVGLFVVLGIAAIVGVRYGIAALAVSAGGGGPREAPTPLATLYVCCTNPVCRACDTVQAPMDFAAWPMICPDCGQAAVYRAELCPKCRRWFATAPGAAEDCWHCRADAARRQPATKKSRSGDPDDAEDGW